MTNFEKIKQMTIEEMAYYLCYSLPNCPLRSLDCHEDNCPECYIHWLISDTNDRKLFTCSKARLL